jgi:hypothetical protein
LLLELLIYPIVYSIYKVGTTIVPLVPLTFIAIIFIFEKIGQLCGVDFEKLKEKYNQTTVIKEVRVFGCSLNSQRIVHYKTSSIEILKHVETNVATLCKNASKELSLPLNHQPLIGHHRFGAGCYTNINPCHVIPRVTRCCASKDGLPLGVQNISIGLVWVRMRDGILATTDPNDPSFLIGNNGQTVKEIPISGSFDVSHFMEKNLLNNTQTEPIGSTLQIVKQQSYDEHAIEMMVRPKDFVKELQTHELNEIQRKYNVETKDIPCFHCEGTGHRWVAIKNVYGDAAGKEAKSSYDSRQNRISDESNDSGNSENNVTFKNMMKLTKITSATLAPAPLAATAPPVRDNASFFQDHGVEVLPSASDASAKTQTITGKYLIVPIGSITSNDTLNQNMMRAASTSIEEDDNDNYDYDKAHPGLDQCWVCCGTGKAEGAVLQNVMDCSKLPNYNNSISNAETKNSETKNNEMNKSISLEEDTELCAICWCDPPKYGISTSCTHFFCVECIQGHLKQILMSGDFPGFCPMCQASAPNGEEPVYGRIDGKAMTFLQRHGVIEKQFQFSFMKKQNEKEELFFECPAKCGNYLVDIDPTYVMRNHAPAVKTERCPCGKGVCVQCHQLVPEDQFFTHRCPEAKIDHSMDDAATLSMMKRLGKKCPNCDMFIIKNEGCDIMMCGDKAHGDLRKAIKAGGCGQTFKWSNLAKIEDNITNFLGQRVKCNPPVKYAKEIAMEKKRLGIVMTDSETKMAELDLEKLEVESENPGVFGIDPAIAPINLNRPVLRLQQHSQKLMNAIRRRDPYHILSEIVHAYSENPKKRINSEARLWREIANAQGPAFGKAGEAAGLWYLYSWYSIPKNILKIAFWPLIICFGSMECGFNKFFGNRSIFMVRTLLFPTFCVACGYAQIWSDGEGPLTWFAFMILLYGIIFHCAASYMDLSHVYNSPLTFACVHGSPDIVRLLLQHGANPNGVSDSLMTPVVAAYAHGNWECVNVLESTYDQHLGHQQLNPQNDGRNWLTRFRLQRGTSAFNCNAANRRNDICWCTPRMCAACFCQCRPPAANAIARRRRGRQEHRHNHDFFNEHGGFMYFVSLTIYAISFFVFIIIWLENGWMWRYKVKNFDWGSPGQYACVRSTADTHPKTSSNVTNRSKWIDIQFGKIGSNGFFSSFSDPELTQLNVDFDFRNVGRVPNRLYTEPLPLPVQMDTIRRSRAKYCPIAETVLKSTIVAQEVKGLAKCVRNCMPCNKIMRSGAEACSNSMDQIEHSNNNNVDNNNVLYTIYKGNGGYNTKTIQHNTAHKAYCRCVSKDYKKALSICNSGTCITDSSKVCDTSFGCSVAGCESKTCTCRPKFGDGMINKMTYFQCQLECNRVLMVVPFSEEGRKKAQGTGCGIDSSEMWVSSEYTSIPSYTIETGSDCSAIIGKEQIKTKEECTTAANALGLAIGTMSDWYRTNVPGGCLLELDDQNVDFNKNLEARTAHSDRRLICKEKKKEKMNIQINLENVMKPDFYSSTSWKQSDEGKCTSVGNDCCACDKSIGMNKCDFNEKATCEADYTPINQENNHGRCRYTCVKTSIYIQNMKGVEYCNVPIQDTTCDSPYFLMGSYKQDPLKALGEVCLKNNECASGYCFCSQKSSASSILAPTALLFTKSTLAIATASMLHFVTHVYARELCFCAVRYSRDEASISMVYTNTTNTTNTTDKEETAEESAEESAVEDKSKCTSNGNDCCACDKSIGMSKCNFNETATCETGYTPVNQENSRGQCQYTCVTRKLTWGDSKCTSNGNDCCACDKSIGMSKCTFNEPATCETGYTPINQENSRGECQYTCVTRKLTWDPKDEDQSKCTSNGNDCCACDKSIGMDMCNFNEPATCIAGYTPVNQEHSHGQCQYICVMRNQDSQNDKLGSGSFFSLSVNKLRFKISGGACNNNIYGNDRRDNDTFNKSIEFGVDALVDADRYQPNDGVPLMMCLGHYFSQPSMMLNVSNIVIDFFHNVNARTSIAEIRNATYNAVTGVNDGALRNDGDGALRENQVEKYIVMSQSTSITGFHCNTRGYSMITAETTCRRAALWYSNERAKDPRNYKKSFQSVMNTKNRPPGCHIAAGGISFNSNLQSTDKDGHDALVCSLDNSDFSYIPGSKVLTFQNGGCGWAPLKNVSFHINGPINVIPSYIYTDINGWILTNQILKDMTVDPGPNVVFASSYYGGSGTNVVGLFDYCDGFRISSNPNDNQYSISSEEKILVSYKSEPLDIR